MSVVEGPWGGRRSPPPKPRRPAPPARPPASPRDELIRNLIASLLLAALIAWSMGPIVALGVVVGVFVHEYGHVLAMNALGCGPARIVIIPFFGGAAVPARAPTTEFKDVIISLAGPVFGLLAMIPFAAAWWWSGQAVWLEAAFFIAFINLINLAPAPPLDGSKALGPALARIHPRVERGVLVVIGAVAVLWAFSRGSWIMGTFLAISVLVTLKRGALRPYSLKLNGREFLVSILLYAGALALCLGALAGALIALDLPATPESVLRLFRFG